MKIIDSKKIKTEFNLYHKFLIWRQKRRVVKRFNSKCKTRLQEGEVYLRVDEVTNTFDAIGYSGRAKIAIEQGDFGGVNLIKQKYEVVYYKGHACFKLYC